MAEQVTRAGVLRLDCTVERTSNVDVEYELTADEQAKYDAFEDADDADDFLHELVIREATNTVDSWWDHDWHVVLNHAK